MEVIMLVFEADPGASRVYATVSLEQALRTEDEIFSHWPDAKRALDLLDSGAEQFKIGSVLFLRRRVR